MSHSLNDTDSLDVIEIDSLNDIIRKMNSYYWISGEHINLDLLDDLPKIYPRSANNYISRILAPLFQIIINQNRTQNKKIKTRLEGEIQILEFMLDGEQLPQEMIEKINRHYQEGARKSTEPSFRGAQRVGYCLNLIGGTIEVSNCEDGGYTVKHTVQLPVKFE